MYYRSFTDFITLPTLTAIRNAGDMGSSVLALFKAYDIFYFLDTIILYILYKVNVKKMVIVKPKRRIIALVFITGIAIFVSKLGAGRVRSSTIIIKNI